MNIDEISNVFWLALHEAGHVGLTLAIDPNVTFLLITLMEQPRTISKTSRAFSPAERYMIDMGGLWASELAGVPSIPAKSIAYHDIALAKTRGLGYDDRMKAGIRGKRLLGPIKEGIALCARNLIRHDGSLSRSDAVACFTQ